MKAEVRRMLYINAGRTGPGDEIRPEMGQRGGTIWWSPRCRATDKHRSRNYREKSFFIFDNCKNRILEVSILFKPE